MTLRVVIADDEELALQKLRYLLSAHRGIDIVGEAADGGTALALLQELRPDAAFLDISMPAMSGIEVVRQAGPQTRIVFTTAYKEHAVEAFEHDTVDYILKPFSRERLDRAIKRLHRRMRTERFAELAQHCVVGEPGAHGSSTEPSIFIKLDGRLVRVATADIIAVVAQGNYISIMTAEKRYFIRATLQEISREIGSGALFQVHRSLLVSLPHINEIRPTPRGSLVLTMSDGSRWKTNRTCREELLRALKENDTTVLRNKSG